jgi:DNA-directed RNA polymerase sigma subunit (sigma70/sigma32)
MDDYTLKCGQNCFSFHNEHNIKCQKTSCRQWLSSDRDLNCTILSARSGPKTLQQIGDIFNLTRMRVCQLEKSIIKKIQQKTKNI